MGYLLCFKYTVYIVLCQLNSLLFSCWLYHKIPTENIRWYKWHNKSFYFLLIFIYCSSPNIHAGANSTRPVIMITRARTIAVVSTRYLPRFFSFYFYTSVFTHLVQSLNNSNRTPTFILPLSGRPVKSIVLLHVTEALVVTHPEHAIKMNAKHSLYTILLPP